VSLSGSLVLAVSDIPAAPVVGMMTFGVVIALVGHVAKSYRVVAVGLAILFIATALMVLVGFAAYNSDETDPRPRENPASPDF
jgi:hypothetical protein